MVGCDGNPFLLCNENFPPPMFSTFNLSITKKLVNRLAYIILRLSIKLIRLGEERETFFLQGGKRR
jgi:hypothetical protein